jgi:hypothetical protein
MSYKLLKKIISDLRRKEKCPYCKSGFNEDFIFVLTTAMSMGGDGCLGLFFIVCEQCHANAFVLTETKKLKNRTQWRKEFIRVDTKRAGRGISVNEVLDMHNFLKNWQGEDVRELFKEI